LDCRHNKWLVKLTPNILSHSSGCSCRKFGHEVDLRLLDDERGRALLVANGARELAGILHLDVIDLGKVSYAIYLHNMFKKTRILQIKIRHKKSSNLEVLELKWKYNGVYKVLHELLCFF